MNWTLPDACVYVVNEGFQLTKDGRCYEAKYDLLSESDQDMYQQLVKNDQESRREEEMETMHNADNMEKSDKTSEPEEDHKIRTVYVALQVVPNIGAEPPTIAFLHATVVVVANYNPSMAKSTVSAHATTLRAT
jgi:archaellin